MRYRRVRITGASYFFTVVTHQRRALFRDPEAVAWLQNAVTLVQEKRPFDIDASVVLPDHLHAIWTLPEVDADYSTRWRLIKEAFTRTYIKHRGPPMRDDCARLRGEQPIWQRRFWEHTIRDERDFQVHVDYIHINPVLHGLVAAPSLWPHSTFKSWLDRGIYEHDWGLHEMPRLPTYSKRDL